jgi:hypothetical protein
MRIVLRHAGKIAQKTEVRFPCSRAVVMRFPASPIWHGNCIGSAQSNRMQAGLTNERLSQSAD